jgi:hypothetical protein
MRTPDVQQLGMFSYVSVDARVPTDHPMRRLQPSGTATIAARWGFTVACAIMLAARIAGWRAVATSKPTAE